MSTILSQNPTWRLKIAFSKHTVQNLNTEKTLTHQLIRHQNSFIIDRFISRLKKQFQLNINSNLYLVVLPTTPKG